MYRVDLDLVRCGRLASTTPRSASPWPEVGVVEATTAAATAATTPTTISTAVPVDATLSKSLHVLPALFVPELLTALTLPVLELARNVVEEARAFVVSGRWDYNVVTLGGGLTVRG